MDVACNLYSHVKPTQDVIVPSRNGEEACNYCDTENKNTDGCNEAINIELSHFGDERFNRFYNHLF